MDLNFFQWLRDAIRKTVLLGVSDAMQSLGPPDEPETMHPHLAALMQSDPDSDAKPATAAKSRSTSTARSRGGAAPRKRLGKSLKELNPTGDKKAA